tara:strand:- start:566 stop:694 length:129 start_codon:yes stop_codon:yes gene_type:complete
MKKKIKQTTKAKKPELIVMIALGAKPKKKKASGKKKQLRKIS